MKAKDIDEVRRQAYDHGRLSGFSAGYRSGQRDMRERATYAVARHRPSLIGLVAFLEIEGPNRHVSYADQTARPLWRRVKTRLRSWLRGAV